MRHLGVPSSLTTGRPFLVMSAVKAVYQKICGAICPCAGTGPDSLNVMRCASLGAFFFIQSIYLVKAQTAAAELVAPPREAEAPPGGPLTSATRMPQSFPGMPLGVPLSAVPAMDSQASVKRHPSDGSFLP